MKQIGLDDVSIVALTWRPLAMSQNIVIRTVLLRRLIPGKGLQVSCSRMKTAYYRCFSIFCWRTRKLLEPCVFDFGLQLPCPSWIAATCHRWRGGFGRRSTLSSVITARVTAPDRRHRLTRLLNRHGRKKFEGCVVVPYRQSDQNRPCTPNTAVAPRLYRLPRRQCIGVRQSAGWHTSPKQDPLPTSSAKERAHVLPRSIPEAWHYRQGSCQSRVRTYTLLNRESQRVRPLHQSR